MEDWSGQDRVVGCDVGPEIDVVPGLFLHTYRVSSGVEPVSLKWPGTQVVYSVREVLLVPINLCHRDSQDQRSI